MTITKQQGSEDGATEHYDAVIIGAGVSGMYALHHLRGMGLSVRAYDGAPAVGGTWWYNRYPGARVDGPSAPLYGYTFSEELVKEWDWTETDTRHIRGAEKSGSSRKPPAREPAIAPQVFQA